MKKFLPLILLLVGIAIIVGAFLLVRSRKTTPGDEEANLPEIPLEKRPVVSLTPTEDGHYLKLKIEKIVLDVDTLDYELLYTTGEGVTQGVPGSVKLEGKKDYETDLLLGSESSGKFRYDEGVESGSISIKYRNKDGKLIAKFESQFRLQTDTDFLTSTTNDFKYKLEKSSIEYFVTLSTLGFPGELPVNLENGPFGVFSSSSDKFAGNTEVGSGNVYFWDGKGWTKLEGGKSENIGIFFGSSQ